jgi:hypothetical protein
MVNKMRRLWFFIIFLTLGLLWVNQNHPCYAQKPLNTLTILYSNNINGEVTPCPA